MPSRRNHDSPPVPEENYAIAFKPGENATSALLRALKEDVASMGLEAISLLRTKHPQDYVKIVLSLEPRTDSKDDAFGDIEDGELRDLVVAAREALGTESGE